MNDLLGNETTRDYHLASPPFISEFLIADYKYKSMIEDEDSSSIRTSKTGTGTMIVTIVLYSIEY